MYFCLQYYVFLPAALRFFFLLPENMLTKFHHLTEVTGSNHQHNIIQYTAKTEGLLALTQGVISVAT